MASLRKPQFVTARSIVFTANHSMLGNFYEKDGKHFLDQEFYLTPGISTYPKAPIA